MNAEDIQVAGNHYKNMTYQTARFGFDVGLESLGTQIAKYLTRDKGSRIENLEKAYHCIALDQQFDEEWKLENSKFCLDIYDAFCDEKPLEKYFSQFEDCEKLKSIMRYYMKAEYSTAKGLLRKYINSVIKDSGIVVGSKVRRVDGKQFSSLTTTVTVKKIKGSQVWFSETGTWLHKEQVKLV